jgi:hypothetical protein
MSTSLLSTVVLEACSLGLPSPEVIATSMAYTSYCSNVHASTCLRWEMWGDMGSGDGGVRVKG